MHGGWVGVAYRVVAEEAIVPPVERDQLSSPENMLRL